METKQNTNEEKSSSESIRTLQQKLVKDLKEGRYYGMDQKIWNIQKACAMTMRV